MPREHWVWREKRLRILYLVVLIFGALMWWARYAEWAWVSLVTQSLRLDTYGPVHSVVRLLRCTWDPDRWEHSEHITSGLWAFTRSHSGAQHWFDWNMCFALLIAPALVGAIEFFVGSRQQHDDLPATRRCRPAALAAASIMGGACLTALALKAMTYTELAILLMWPGPATSRLIALGFCGASAGFAAVSWRYIVAGDGYWRLERISRVVLVLGAVTWGASWITAQGRSHRWSHRFSPIDISETARFTGATAVLWAGTVRLILLWRIDRYRVRRQEVLCTAPRCLDCGYELRGSLDLHTNDKETLVRRVNCPECGAAVSSETVKLFREGPHAAG